MSGKTGKTQHAQEGASPMKKWRKAAGLQNDFDFLVSLSFHLEVWEHSLVYGYEYFSSLLDFKCPFT